ncbi:MAG TPA: O-antigen ligase family protein [Chthoniobacterales bacterium]|nr:O-antigen ligase family protein [Chthoniobacterales bacterium]
MAIPTLPVLACFLGGATEKWSEGIIVALFGLILLADPPRLSLGRVLNVILLAMVACAATAFLPESWFLRPAWRAVLTNDFGIALPGTLSPQPWISLGCFVSFLAGLSWLYYVSTLDLELREVRQQLRFFAAGIVLLATLCLTLYYAQTALPFWHNQRGFGPFPNRNQTANLFGLTAIVILACGQEDIRQSRRRWIVWLLALALIVAAIILNFSRAGILILVSGSALWLGGFVLRKGSAARIALGLSVLLVLLTVMLIFGGQTFERFNLRAGEGGDMAADLRWAIFRDALQLIRASPWFGLGLGNFDEVFAVFRDASLTGARTIHPESDWFWLWVEGGWPVILLAIAGLALLVWRVFPLQEGTNQRFRLAALIAALLFALHGLVDVSGHRVGTAFSGIFFLGMALRRPAELVASSWLPRLFRLIGLLLLSFGIAWVVAARYQMALPGGVGAENEMRKASAASQGRNFSETIQRTTRALEWAPLKWQLYFSRAVGKVGAKLPPAEALDDFRRARFLEPNVYEVPYQEGIVWLAREPALAITAWREALRRVGVQRLEVYGHMLALASQHSPAVRQGLEEIGMAHHDLALVYLQGAAGADFMKALHRLLELDPNLQIFSGEERVRFFAVWAERGDRKELLSAVEAHPEWMKDAWRSVAKDHASRNDFRRACELVRRFGQAPRLPEAPAGSSIDQLRQAFHANPDNYGAGFQFYQEQMRLGKIDEALMTVRHFTEQPGAPGYFHFLEAEAWAAKASWERAWKAWEKFDAARKP